MPQNRLLVAIMFADIEGYTSLMQNNEDQALLLRKKHRKVIDTVTEKYNGELIQYYGDGTLSIFKSSVEAIRCGIELQKEFQKEPSIPVRIGVHVGDIVRTESDIIGNAVNVASRVESLGISGSILISDSVNEQLRNHKEISTKYLDVFNFKNVEKPIPVYAVSNEGIKVPELNEIDGKTKERVNRRFKTYKRVSAAVLVALLAVIISLLFLNNNGKKNIASNNITLAVLPFDNMNKDSESEFFTDGISEDILLQLSKINDLHVISQSSAMKYKESEKSVSEIADELGVEFVLEGSVRKLGDKVRINAQLISADNNQYLWGENYDKTLVEVFEIQSQVSNEIAKALKITLSIDEQSNLNKIPTKNAAAYTIYQQARRLLHQGGGTLPELDKARDLFEQVIEMDPNFSSAYVGLADTYLSYIYWGRAAPIDVLEKAQEAALIAHKLDPNEGGTYGALGSISFYRHEKETAIDYLEKALEINPSYVLAYDKLAYISIFQGDPERAISLFEKIYALDPLSTRYIGNIGQAYYYFNDYEDGLEFMNKSLEKHPDDNMLLWMKGNLLTGKKSYDEAIKTFNSRSDGINTNWMLGYAYGASGDKEKARYILNYQLEKAKTKFVPPFMIAVIYMGLGNESKALEYLEMDYEVGGQGLFFWGLNRDPIFDPIRDEPRFQKLLDVIK
jgi:TolB-like protein/class 3 adenylate cyclase/Flp pilus assembly protein TadD